MIRENEYLRERLSHREIEKLDRAAERMHDKAESIMRYKDWIAAYPPPYHHYPYTHPAPTHTTIIDKNCCEGGCSSSCGHHHHHHKRHHHDCRCKGACECNEKYVYLLPSVKTSRYHPLSRSEDFGSLKRIKSLEDIHNKYYC